MKLRILAMLLALVLLLQGCGILDRAGTGDASGAPIVSTESRPYAPRLDPLVFSKIDYVRQDAEQLCADIHALTQEIADGADDVDAVAMRYDILYDRYIYFNTMLELAYIYYTLDLSDAYYSEESARCEEELPLIEQALEACYMAMADSSLRDALEEQYFGEDFFLSYDGEGFYSDDLVVELMQEEAELQNQYLELQLDYTTYESRYQEAADLYIRLIRVRRELAQTLGYDSYAQFAYEYYYYRDYTPEQAARYTDEIAAQLNGLLPAALENEYYVSMRTDEAFSLMEGAVRSFGGEFSEAFDYMTAYELYDLSDGKNKMGGSYTTYLESYEMPFLFLSPTGTSDDLLTVTHEFGHFVDSYVNCNLTATIDCAEIFSNGLEYLMLDCVELSERERERLTAGKLSDALYALLSQACYAEFERRAYSLPDAELTADRLGEVFIDCCGMFGLLEDELYSRQSLSQSWVVVHHFFIAPFYVISYCISEDVALQIYACELENGSGLSAYRRLLEYSAGNTFLNLLSEAEMASPFDEGRMEALYAFFMNAFSKE